MSESRELRSALALRWSALSYSRGWAMGTTSAVRLWHTRATATRSIHLHENRLPTDMRNKTPRGARSTEKQMKVIVVALALGIAGAPNGEAADAKSLAPALELKPKVALAAPAQSRHAPFMAASAEPDVALGLEPRRDERLESSRSSCSGERSLCYDPGSGRIVYKPARAFMPDIPGMQPENISVKRDRIVLRYSF